MDFETVCNHFLRAFFVTIDFIIASVSMRRSQVELSFRRTSVVKKENLHKT